MAHKRFNRKPIARTGWRLRTISRSRKEREQGRTKDDAAEDLHQESLEPILAPADELGPQVEGLKALRKLAGLNQRQVAQRLGVKPPTVSRFEGRTDLHLSTLRRFIEAAGGTLELRVELPGREPFTLTGLGEIDLD